MLNSTWLEELASESNTIQAQEDIMSARVMASNIRPKLYVLLGWLFDDISGLLYSFELTRNVEDFAPRPWSWGLLPGRFAFSTLLVSALECVYTYIYTCACMQDAVI